MHATEILTAEHRVIEQVLDCLDRLIERGSGTDSFDWQSADEIIDFLRHFADECHHGKEEQHLFPALEARGFSPQLGPTGVMRHEHEQGRKLIRTMAESVAAAQRGEAGQTASFVNSARAYGNLLRQHIHKEDHCLFPMADQALNDVTQQELLGAFEAVEHSPQLEGHHARYLEMADTLAKRFGVAKTVPAAAHAHACCGHHK